MTSIPGVSTITQGTAAPAPPAAGSGIDFAGILDAAKRGEKLTDSQKFAWLQHQYEAGKLGLQPDEVQMSGQLEGFKMDFPAGFPADLKQRMEQTYAGFKTVKDRYQFMDMYSSTFVGDSTWDSGWRTDMKSFIKNSTAFASGQGLLAQEIIRQRNDMRARLLAP